MNIEVMTIGEFYAGVLNPLKDEELTLQNSPVNWDGEKLSFVRHPSVTVVPGDFHIQNVRVNGMTIQAWNLGLEKEDSL